jgi:hypothetical protein
MGDYYAKYVYLLTLDVIAQIQQFAEELKGSETLVNNLSLIERDDHEQFAITSNKGETIKGFARGDQVLLVPARDDPTVLIEAKIISVAPNFVIKVTLLEEVPENALTIEWKMMKDTNDITYRRMVTALQLLCEKGDQATALFPILQALNDPTSKSVLDIASHDVITAKQLELVNLNPSQQRAVDLGFRQRLTIVQGPPGTGSYHNNIISNLSRQNAYACATYPAMDES